MAESKSWQSISTNLTQEQFEEFVLPHLKQGTRGLQPNLSLHVRLSGLHYALETLAYTMSAAFLPGLKVW